MRFIKKIIVICWMTFFVWVVDAQSQPRTPSISITLVCSNSSRTQGNSQTYQTIYSPSEFQKKYFKDINWNKSVVWVEARYDNTRSLQQSCKEWFIDGELWPWNDFWNKYFSVYKTFFSTNNSRESSPFYTPKNIWTLQSYILWACGLNIVPDGKLGKKTVNSVAVCKQPPAWWKLWRVNFESLVGWNALFTDEKWTNLVYTGDQFVTWFDPDTMYVDTDNTVAKTQWIADETTASVKWLKIVKKDTNTSTVCKTVFGTVEPPKDAKEEWWKCCYVWDNVEVWPPKNPSWVVKWTNATYTPSINSSTPTLLSIWWPITIPVCWTTSENTTTTCRFIPPKEGTPERIQYDAEKLKLWADTKVPTDCKSWCGNGFTETKAWWASLCEKCDIEKCNCGIKLNTNIPFIGRCIMNEKTNNVGQSGNVTTVNTLNAFPILMGALIKLLMSIIMLVCFGSLIVWWFMMTVPDQYETGKWLIKKVIRTIVALWSLWTILYLINPNFFS